MPEVLLSSEMVVERLTALFSSNKAVFNFPDANRVASRAQLADHLSTNDDTVAWISDYQGAGKSTLIEMVTNDFGWRTDRPMVRARDVSENRLREDFERFQSVFVDDADIRTTWPRIEAGLEAVRDFVRGTPCPVVICGDFAIRDGDLRRLFADLPQTDIQMEPVDRDFLLDALNGRLQYLFPDMAAQLGDKSNHLFADEVLECLVPASVVPVATFREVLTLSEGMAHSVDPGPERFLLTREHARAYCKARPLSDPTSEQKRFLREWLKPFVTDVHPLGRGMTSFEATDVLRDVAIDGLEDPGLFSASVLEPLAAGGILHALGTPSMLDGQFRRYCPPYVPRPTFLLYALASDEI